MPIERGYDQQIGPAAPVGLPQASAAAFGAGVGQGLEQLGGAMHGSELRAYQIQRQQTADSEAANFNAQFARARADADKASVDARNGMAPGGAGHAEAMDKWWAARSATLLDGITEDRVRRSAEAQLQEFGDRFGAAEYQFQEGARVGKVVSDTQATSDIAANRAYRMHDPKAFAEELSLGRQAIEAMPGVPPEVKDKLVRHHDQTVSVGFLNGVVDTNAKAVAPLLDSGQFDDILSPEQADRLRSGAQVELRRQDAIVEHQAALQKSQVREQIATVRAQVAAGIDVDPATIAQAEQASTGMGDTSGAVELHAMRIGAQLNKATQPWTPQQYQTQIQQLEAKGGKRSADEDIALKQLKSIAPARIDAFRKDPGSWAAMNGNPAPALNPADPASIAARRQWATTVSGVTHLPTPFLQPQEVESYRARLMEGPAARVDVVNEIAGYGGQTAVAAIRQVAPQDDMAARMVLLRPGDRAAVSNGAEARKANPALIDGKAGADARAAFLERVGPATALMGQGDVGAAFDVARNLYADYAAKNGIQTFEPKIWNSFIHRALGGTRDGDGQYHGGVGGWNGASVLLPPALSQGQFESVLSHMAWNAKDQAAPVFRGGQAMTPADVRRYTPVQRPDGRYEFHGTGNTVIQTRGGSIWTLDIGALGKRYLK